VISAPEETPEVVRIILMRNLELELLARPLDSRRPPIRAGMP
jgi:hypothetical protein